MRPVPLAPAVAAASSLLVLLTACGSSGADPGRPAGDDAVTVVASTNVYGDIAATIGGPDVEVTSIIDDPSADPHSFEANTRTQLAVSEADVVVRNGGGYDDFVDTLVSSTGTGATVVDAVDVSGREASAEAAGEELNEHVWYDLETIGDLADEIARALGEVDAGNAGTYEANATDFNARVDDLLAGVAELRTGTSGAGVAVTEPVPGYLLDALGAENRTPEEFSEAIEEGGDVSPAVLQETLDLVTGGSVRAVVYNAQTTGPETEQVKEAAEGAGVAVVAVTETLPEGEDYVSWMQANIDAVGSALSS
jgi:zinc/manganese transport system substrate-binding protein